MRTSSLRKNRPHLESVLGALSNEDDVKIREIFDEVDEILLEIAGHFGRDRAGWDGTGLALTWMESGQVDISSFVETGTNEGLAVCFCLELRPSWRFGDRSSTLSWVVESSVSADCSHAVDHEHMHAVHEVVARAASAIDAATTARSAARELQRLAADFPIEHWLSLASDANG